LGAELQVAAETEMERVEFFGGDDSDDPSGVFLVSMAPRRAPEPIGVPAKKIDEIMPELEASAADVEVTCFHARCSILPPPHTTSAMLLFTVASSLWRFESSHISRMRFAMSTRVRGPAVENLLVGERVVKSWRSEMTRR
jgi:hypothetical protein